MKRFYLGRQAFALIGNRACNNRQEVADMRQAAFMIGAWIEKEYGLQKIEHVKTKHLLTATNTLAYRHKSEVEWSHLVAAAEAVARGVGKPRIAWNLSRAYIEANFS